MKKWEVIAQLIERHCRIFRCPVCRNSMHMDSASLVCANKHTFDLSRRGYLNLLLRPIHTRYDRAMLTARHALCQSGFFTPLIQAMSDLIIQEHVMTRQTTSLLLDAGCGEGSHLLRLVDTLQQVTPYGIQGIGMDISKDGIRLAARDAWQTIWCVANLSQLPIQDQQCNIVVNILSPANYAEFGRVLANHGMLVKVIPGSQHLRELRAIVHDGTTEPTSSHERVIHHFCKHFTQKALQHLVYPVTIPPKQAEQLIAMTPLSWNVDAETRKRVLSVGLSTVTVDLYILVGEAAPKSPARRRAVRF